MEYQVGIDGRYHYLYEITHLPSGKRYRGMRTSDKSPDLDAAYMGSGKHIRLAIAKHGVENFSKEIFLTADNREELGLLEVEYSADEGFWKRGDTYNLVVGDASLGTYNKTVPEETRAKLSKAATGRTPSPETRVKLTEGNRRRTHYGNPEFRANLSKGQLASKKLPKNISICEHCWEDVSNSQYKLHHGDRCKFNPINATVPKPNYIRGVAEYDHGCRRCGRVVTRSGFLSAHIIRGCQLRRTCDYCNEWVTHKGYAKFHANGKCQK